VAIVLSDEGYPVSKAAVPESLKHRCPVDGVERIGYVRERTAQSGWAAKIASTPRYTTVAPSRTPTPNCQGCQGLLHALPECVSQVATR